MTEGLERSPRIDRTRLRGREYFASLVEQACVCGLLSARDTERLQMECLALLARQLERYNRGMSSSVRVERAQELLESIFFTLSLALKAAPSPDEAAELLRRESIEQLFARGRTRLTRKLQTAQLLHRRLKDGLFETPNVFYRATLVDGIDGFFRLYRPDFFAQEVHITADYPTAAGPCALDGIEFIERYLHDLDCENRFLRRFDAQSVDALLCSLEEGYHLVPMNLFMPVLGTALGCMLTGQNVFALRCEEEALRARLGGLDRTASAALLEKAAKVLGALLALPEGVQRYTGQRAPQLAAELERRWRYGAAPDAENNKK